MVVPSLVRQSVQLCLYHRINNVQSVLALPFRVLLKYILCVTCPVHARTDLVSRYRLACVNPVVTRSQVMFIFSPPHVFDQSGTLTVSDGCPSCRSASYAKTLYVYSEQYRSPQRVSPYQKPNSKSFYSVCWTSDGDYLDIPSLTPSSPCRLRRGWNTPEKWEDNCGTVQHFFLDRCASQIPDRNLGRKSLIELEQSNVSVSEPIRSG